jgi:hypothetical protein
MSRRLIGDQSSVKYPEAIFPISNSRAKATLPPAETEV